MFFFFWITLFILCLQVVYISGHFKFGQTKSSLHYVRGGVLAWTCNVMHNAWISCLSLLSLSFTHIILVCKKKNSIRNCIDQYMYLDEYIWGRFSCKKNSLIPHSVNLPGFTCNLPCFSQISCIIYLYLWLVDLKNN